MKPVNLLILLFGLLSLDLLLAIPANSDVNSAIPVANPVYRFQHIVVTAQPEVVDKISRN